jgi:hypothetical protein
MIQAFIDASVGMELGAIHEQVAASGLFDEATAKAVAAFLYASSR